MICWKQNPSQNSFVYRIQNKDIFFMEEELFKEKREGRIEQKMKRRLFNSPRYGD